MRYLFIKYSKLLQLLTLLFLFDFHTLIAQNNRIDSLMLVIKSTVEKDKKFVLNEKTSKTKKGKISKGSFGKSRPAKAKKAAPKKAAAKK